MENIRPKTIICDIDGTLIKHVVPGDTKLYSDLLLPGTIKKLQEWDIKGYNIILLTGRRESEREFTKKQLSALGIFYDQLIMGAGGGTRILINDKKPDGAHSAISFNIERNFGINDIIV